MYCIISRCARGSAAAAAVAAVAVGPGTDCPRDLPGVGPQPASFREAARNRIVTTITTTTDATPSGKQEQTKRQQGFPKER